ncbi:aminoacetone oxidase family FAD-binding enzyme [Terrimonas sp.]|uniref:NAD(P)/FAD-dependent oxidoreductase n=1 Tax=Terrimonas sp. TaxID=1914338 RepID=UPI000D523C3B|nr:NAD(P)/FAD-dependent oxidoreductase [Terrimonas sp.]PVD52916.1 aminoacetone oxidase family FAD-binding enzyme [Terrimonas sp.]
MKQKHLVVIGGGAAGFFTAVNAAAMNTGIKVTILEKSSKVLAKVRVSGGGRCNVTHACFDIDEMIRRYPRGTNFLKKAFHHFFTTDTIQWFEEKSVELKAEADGRMFPASNTSEAIINCLLKEANKNGVEIRMNAEVRKIIINKDDEARSGFYIHLANENILHGDYLCIACGGYPKAAQFDWLKELGHTIATPVPSLFTFNIPGSAITGLMGVSVENAIVKIKGAKLSEKGSLLITHWGLSGPAVLKLSAWGARALADMQYNFSITVNWLPDFNEQTLRNEWSILRQQYGAQKIYTRNPFRLPARLWVYLLEETKIQAEQRWSDITAAQQQLLIQHLTMHHFDVKGKTTFKEEFVTCGGISLNDIDVNTMQSKKQPGLFFAGEVIDVDGITGGFNFQNAWTTGWIAAKAIATKA